MKRKRTLIQSQENIMEVSHDGDLKRRQEFPQ